MAAYKNVRVLLGAEASPGTTASSFEVWLGTAELHEVRDRQFAEETVGLISKNTRFADVQLKSEGTLETDQANYEQIIYPLAMVIQDVTPTGGPTYTWTFDPNLGSITDPATMTCRYGVDGKFYQSDYVIGGGLTITSPDTGAWSVSCDLMGGTVTTSGYVSNETMDVVNPIIGSLDVLSIDGAWADLGNTAVSGYLIDWTWELPGWHQKQFKEGSLEPTDHGLDGRAATLTMTVEWDTARDTTERTAWRAGTVRFIRLYNSDGTRSVTIDGAYVITDMATIGDRDGNITVEYTLESIYDITSGKEYEVVVVNAVASL